MRKAEWKTARAIRMHERAAGTNVAPRLAPRILALEDPYVCGGV